MNKLSLVSIEWISSLDHGITWLDRESESYYTQNNSNGLFALQLKPFISTFWILNMDEKNPVVLLSENNWHVVDNSRGSTNALCGREIRDRRAHSRLKTIGRDHLCQDCLLLFDGELKSKRES
ncbi:MAG: hypothetical protein R6X18_17095 [Chloroflexota bacterium]|jgi:hypothetical protein